MDKVQVKIDGNNVLFMMPKLEKSSLFFGALFLPPPQGTFLIPLQHIISVSTNKISFMEPMGKGRPPGLPAYCEWPSLLSGVCVYSMSDRNSCITVNLKDEPYSKMVLEVENKDIAAKIISDAMNKKQTAAMPSQTSKIDNNNITKDPTASFLGMYSNLARILLIVIGVIAVAIFVAFFLMVLGFALL